MISIRIAIVSFTKLYKTRTVIDNWHYQQNIAKYFYKLLLSQHFKNKCFIDQGNLKAK